MVEWALGKQRKWGKQLIEKKNRAPWAGWVRDVGRVGCMGHGGGWGVLGRRARHDGGWARAVLGLRHGAWASYVQRLGRCAWASAPARPGRGGTGVGRVGRMEGKVSWAGGKKRNGAGPAGKKRRELGRREKTEVGLGPFVFSIFYLFFYLFLFEFRYSF